MEIHQTIKRISHALELLPALPVHPLPNRHEGSDKQREQNQNHDDGADSGQDLIQWKDGRIGKQQAEIGSSIRDIVSQRHDASQNRKLPANGHQQPVDAAAARRRAREHDQHKKRAGEPGPCKNRPYPAAEPRGKPHARPCADNNSKRNTDRTEIKRHGVPLQRLAAEYGEQRRHNERN